MTPGESIRHFCLGCAGGTAHEVRQCGGDACMNDGCDEHGVCYLYRYRLGSGRPSVKTIRKVCLWCMGDRADFVRECNARDCALHPYRMSKNPNIVLSEAERSRRKLLLTGKLSAGISP